MCRRQWWIPGSSPSSSYLSPCLRGSVEFIKASVPSAPPPQSRHNSSLCRLNSGPLLPFRRVVLSAFVTRRQNDVGKTVTARYFGSSIRNHVDGFRLTGARGSRNCHRRCPDSPQQRTGSADGDRRCSEIVRGRGALPS